MEEEQEEGVFEKVRVILWGKGVGWGKGAHKIQICISREAELDHLWGK